MRSFRSILLKPMPPSPRLVDRRRLMWKRGLLVGVLALVILLEMILIQAGYLSKKGAGFVFYAFHDYVYLTLKGYTYTLFHPLSVVWLGLAATLCCLALGAYVLVRAPLKGPQVQLLRWGTGRKGMLGLLKTSAAWLDRMGLRPLLMEEVVAWERAQASLELMEAPNPPASEQIDRLVDLTRFAVYLRQIRVSKAENPVHHRLDTLALWHETLLQLRVRAGLRSEPSFIPAITRMAAQAEDVLKPLCHYKIRTLRGRVLSMPAGFDRRTVAMDLVYLACLHNETLAGQVLEGEQCASPQNIRYAVVARLAASTAARREKLHGLRYFLESAVFQAASSRRWDNECSAWLRGSHAGLRANSQTALRVALELAALTRDTDLAMGYLDALETLDFALDMSRDATSSPQLERRMRALTQDIPGTLEYRLCAELARNALESRRRDWETSILAKRGPIKPADFHMASSRVASLIHASGPGPDPPDGEASAETGS